MIRAGITKMKGRWLFCVMVAVFSRCSLCQTVTATLISQDFQKKNVKAKRENVEYFSHYGLMLRDRSQPGRVQSESIELPSGVTALVLQWSSSIAADDLTIRLQTSKDGKTWSHWFIANDQVRLNPHNNLYSGRLVNGFGEARYVRYEAEIKPELPPKVPGVLASVNIICVSAGTQLTGPVQSRTCSIDEGCR